MKYMVRAVSRDLSGKVTDIADTWPLNADSLDDAKAEVDRQHRREPGDVANAFEITDKSGNAFTSILVKGHAGPNEQISCRL